MKSLKRVLGCVRKADEDYGLIENGDKICVGISGGKDSSVLLYNLYLYQKFSGKQYDLMGIYCDLGFGNEGIENVAAFFAKYDIPVYIYPTQISEILDLHRDADGKLECSLCSKLRKGAIIRAAKEYGCNKIAFGHHNDDALETLLMNMIHGGRVATFKPKTYLERSEVDLIRPLIYAYENDIIKVAQQLEIPISKNLCGNDGVTEREEMKKLLKQIYHQYPQAKDNFALMLRNSEQVELFKPDKNQKQKEKEEKNESTRGEDQKAG